MSTPPLNISSDDAAFFALSSSGADADAGSDDEDTEDPGGSGTHPIGQLNMFRSRPPQKRHLTRGGFGQPSTQVNLTRGANIIPH